MDLSEPDEQPEKSKLLVLFKTTSAAGAIDKFSVPEAIGKDEKKKIFGVTCDLALADFLQPHIYVELWTSIINSLIIS